MARQQGQFSAQFKRETVLEVLRGEKPIAQICRERQVMDAPVYKWRQDFLEKAPGLFETKQTAATVHNEQAERLAELERLVGHLTMENALLRKERVGWKQPAGDTGYVRRAAKPGQPQTPGRGIRLPAQHVLLSA